MNTTIRSIVRWLFVGLMSFGYLKLLLAPSVVAMVCFFVMFCTGMFAYTRKWHKKHVRPRFHLIKSEIKSA